MKESTLNNLLVGKTITQFVSYPPSGLHIFLGDSILCILARGDDLEVDILGSTPDDETEERRDRWGE